MPLYEYELTRGREKIGELQLPLPVEARDNAEVILPLLPGWAEGCRFRRIEVPRSIAIMGSARNPGETSNQVLDAYKRIERRLGSNSEFQRRIGHTPEEIRRAWGDGR